jgi:hypothetical protein
MRKWIFFTLIAFVFALLHACSLDNDMLKPNCEIFEIELVEKVWTPTGSKAGDPLFFTVDGLLREGASADSITYNIQNCNTLSMFNKTTGESREWTIEHLDLDKMTIKKGSETITYTPNK